MAGGCVGVRSWRRRRATGRATYITLRGEPEITGYLRFAAARAGPGPGRDRRHAAGPHHRLVLGRLHRTRSRSGSPTTPGTRPPSPGTPAPPSPSSRWAPGPAAPSRTPRTRSPSPKPGCRTWPAARSPSPCSPGRTWPASTPAKPPTPTTSPVLILDLGPGDPPADDAAPTAPRNLQAERDVHRPGEPVLGRLDRRRGRDRLRGAPLRHQRVHPRAVTPWSTPSPTAPTFTDTTVAGRHRVLPGGRRRRRRQPEPGQQRGRRPSTRPQPATVEVPVVADALVYEAAPTTRVRRAHLHHAAG